MNKLSLIILTLLSLVVLGFFACKKEVKKGCMDPEAVNYDKTAQEDDATCEYLDSTATLWMDGAGVYSENQSTGGVVVDVCFGTLVDDTSGMYTGQPLVLMKDSMGDFSVFLRSVNMFDTRFFGNGYLLFDALVPANSALETFDVYIHGKTCFDKMNNCGERICIGAPVKVNTAKLDSVTFTEVMIPLLDFDKRYLSQMDNFFGIRDNVQDGGDTVLVINNVRWKLRLDE